MPNSKLPKRNYRIEQEKILKTFRGETPSLLLHSCCAPCSSAVLEYLSQYMAITVFYFNPNIFPEEEFLHRIAEQKRLIGEMPCQNKVNFTEQGWQQERFYSAVKGLENIPEGGERCFACYRLRLEETAKLAAEKGFDYFATTLSVSPYKNADKLNGIGEELAARYGVKHLPSDFKKRDGYKRSIELSAEYGLYRQDYCGCVFSKKERERVK
ncbi:MAG: epoxyqueuosine reductase QueH [Muribaculaceae bacterium]|nr:epoxyqueuosine reductase QueH [Muribaculaceae bacterium]MCM1479794.1 epoxyqueuosine reductase QueH [Muribaculaceae bacterium]